MKKAVAVAAGVAMMLSLCGCTAFLQGVREGVRGQNASEDFRITIPELAGKTGAVANDELSGLDVQFTDSTGAVDSYDVDERIVESTDPAAGKKLTRGSTVTVTLVDVVTDDGSSADAPAPAGSVITSTQGDGTSYDLTFGGVTWDAGAAVAAENQFNDPAPAGQQYALVSVTFKNTGSTEVRPGVEAYGITYVDPAGGSHSLGDTNAVIPNSLSGASVPPGASVSGNFDFLVPAGTASGGVFAIKGSPYFFVAAS